MPSTGFTVTPDITEDPVTGEVTYNVMNAQVLSNGSREAIRDDVQRQAQDSFQVNDKGDLESVMDFTEQDSVNLLESVGGEELYTEALKWAGENLDSEDIEFYDKAMQSGNIAEVHDLMQQLMQRYNEALSNESEYADFENYFFSEVVSKEDFPVVNQFIRDFMDADFIDATNKAIDTNDYAEYEALIKYAIGQMENQ